MFIYEKEGKLNIMFQSTQIPAVEEADVVVWKDEGFEQALKECNPVAIMKTITKDNGSEFAEHEWITRNLDVPVYFADSYCSWQKGAVENENKLVRQYIPKGTDISTVTDAKIRKIRMKINARPREKLNFNTPTECFYKNIS